jgi:hypothetical protein
MISFYLVTGAIASRSEVPDWKAASGSMEVEEHQG